MPVTLQHIANAAKVSRTTVSLALRHHPKISVAMRKRVQVLDRKLGYRPNPLVAAHANHLWLAGYSVFQALAPAGDRIPHFITAEWKKSVVVADLNCNQRGLPDRPKTVLIQADWKDGQTHRKRSNVKPGLFTLFSHA